MQQKAMFKNKGKKQLDNYLNKYDHKQVKILLLNGEELIGKIHTNARFDVKLDTQDGRRLIINRGMIVYVQILEKTSKY